MKERERGWKSGGGGGGGSSWSALKSHGGLERPLPASTMSDHISVATSPFPLPVHLWTATHTQHGYTKETVAHEPTKRLYGSSHLMDTAQEFSPVKHEDVSMFTGSILYQTDPSPRISPLVLLVAILRRILLPSLISLLLFPPVSCVTQFNALSFSLITRAKLSCGEAH